MVQLGIMQMATALGNMQMAWMQGNSLDFSISCGPAKYQDVTGKLANIFHFIK